MDFSIKQALKFGWVTTKKHYAQVIVVMLLSLLINGVLRFLSDATENSSDLFNVALFLSTMLGVIILELIFQIGVIKEALHIVRGHQGSIKKILSHHGIFWKVLSSWLLYGLLIVGAVLVFIAPLFSLAFVFDIPALIPIALVLAIIGGIFVAIIFGFSRVIVVDKECGPIESLRISEDITKGVRWELVFFFGLIILLNMAGALLLGLGLLVTVPVSFFAILEVYNILILRHKREVLADLA